MKWPDLIAALLRVKDAQGRPIWNCGSIAKHCGCTRARIGQLRQPGTEPSWSVGQRIIALHDKMQANLQREPI